MLYNDHELMLNITGLKTDPRNTKLNIMILLDSSYPNISYSVVIFRELNMIFLDQLLKVPFKSGYKSCEIVIARFLLPCFNFMGYDSMGVGP